MFLSSSGGSIDLKICSSYTLWKMLSNCDFVANSAINHFLIVIFADTHTCLGVMIECMHVWQRLEFSSPKSLDSIRYEWAQKFMVLTWQKNILQISFQTCCWSLTISFQCAIIGSSWGSCIRGGFLAQDSLSAYMLLLLKLHLVWWWGSYSLTFMGMRRVCYLLTQWHLSSHSIT